MCTQMWSAIQGIYVYCTCTVVRNKKKRRNMYVHRDGTPYKYRGVMYMYCGKSVDCTYVEKDTVFYTH